MKLEKIFLYAINYLYKESERKSGQQNLGFYKLKAVRYFQM